MLNSDVLCRPIYIDIFYVSLFPHMCALSFVCVFSDAGWRERALPVVFFYVECGCMCVCGSVDIRHGVSVWLTRNIVQLKVAF